MTTTFTLTENETAAALVLVKSCLRNMGGKRPSDLNDDKFTWVDATDLMAAGWNKNEAAGTFGTLIEKGLIDQYSKKEWVLTDDGFNFLDTIWDAATGEVLDATTRETTHFCETTGDAYDDCQCDDDFKNGDLIIVESEQVVGIVGTWPIAITVACGKLHQPNPVIIGEPEEIAECTTAQLQAAIKAAKDRGWEINPIFLTSEKETAEMTIALIDIANLQVEFCADENHAAQLAETRGLYFVRDSVDLTDLTGAQMVAIYNATSAELDLGLAPVTRFATKEAGIKRLWANINDLRDRKAAPAANPHAASNKLIADAIARDPSIVAPKASKARDGAAPAKHTDTPPVAIRRGTGINLAPLAKIYPCRQGSKQALLVDFLNRPQGATMAELLVGMSGGSKPWKEVSVKSGLNWDMNKIKGYGIRTTKRGTEDCYHLVLPAGMTAPLPHTTKTGVEGGI